MNINFMVVSNMPQNILWNEKSGSGTIGPVVRVFEEFGDALTEARELKKKFGNEYLVFPVGEQIPTEY